MMWKEAVLRRFGEKTRSGRSVAGRIGVNTWPRIYIVRRVAGRNTNSNTMEPDRPLLDRPAAYLSPSSTLPFLALCAASENSERLKKCYYINYFLNF